MLLQFGSSVSFSMTCLSRRGCTWTACYKLLHRLSWCLAWLSKQRTKCKARFWRAAATYGGGSKFVMCLYKHSLLVHVVHTLAAAVQRGNSASIPAVSSATEPLTGAAPSVSDSDSTIAFLRGLPADGPAGGSAAADSCSSFASVSLASLSLRSASACQAQRSVEQVGKARSRSCSTGPIRLQRLGGCYHTVKNASCVTGKEA